MDFMKAPLQARSQLSTHVASYVRELIVSGNLRRGDFIRIEAVAKAMGISNTPVREGLLLLQSENFVQLVPRRGFRVLGFSRQDLRDLFWVQSILAGELAARAAVHITEAEIATVEQIQAEHEKSIARNDEAAFTHLGHQYHRAINLAARSNRLAMALGGLTKQLPNRFYAAIEGQLKDTLHYHPLILSAIKRRDADSARELMRQHIVSAADHLIVLLEQQGMWAREDQETEAQSADG